MYRILDMIIKEQIRKCRNMIIKNPILIISLICGVVYLIYYIPSLITILGDDNMKYLVWLVNIYLLLKIINTTQGMVIDYQLIQMKMISLRDFKVLIVIKSLATSVVVTTVLYFFRNDFSLYEWKCIIVLALLNSAVNVYSFLKSIYDSYVVELLMALVCCVIVYTNSIIMSIAVFWTTIMIFLNIKKMNYEKILLLYRMMYQVGQRFTGVAISEVQNSQIQRDKEVLFGKEKLVGTEWCQENYDSKRKFYQRKEWARVMANKDKLIMYVIISLIASIGVFYFPMWYKTIAVIIQILIAYEFCYEMLQPEKSLYKYGYIEKYSFSYIYGTKWSVYSLVSMVIILPSVFSLGIWFWLLPIFAVMVAVFAISKCFGKEIVKNSMLREDSSYDDKKKMSKQGENGG